MHKIRGWLSTLKAIHSSRLEYSNELTEEQKRRLEICSKCEFNSDNSYNMTIRDKVFLSLNKILNRFYGIRVMLSAMCTICGCQLMFLSTQEAPENKCRKKKW